MQVTIDRFEGKYAVVELENRTMADMPASLVPEGAEEGDILKITIDKEETEKRKKHIKKLMDELWK